MLLYIILVIWFCTKNIFFKFHVASFTKQKQNGDDEEVDFLIYL
jgi:hypothetical protein